MSQNLDRLTGSILRENLIEELQEACAQKDKRIARMAALLDALPHDGMFHTPLEGTKMQFETKCWEGCIRCAWEDARKELGI